MAQTDQEIIDINGIPVLPVPDEVMVGMGWKVGDTLLIDYDPETGFASMSQSTDDISADDAGDELSGLDDLL